MKKASTWIKIVVPIIITLVAIVTIVIINVLQPKKTVFTRSDNSQKVEVTLYSKNKDVVKEETKTTVKYKKLGYSRSDIQKQLNATKKIYKNSEGRKVKTNINSSTATEIIKTDVKKYLGSSYSRSKNNYTLKKLTAELKNEKFKQSN